MTTSEWILKANENDSRADRIRGMIADRAKVAFDSAFGHCSDSYTCFLYAHNWHGMDWLTPAQNRACRLVKHLDSKRWEPSTIAKRINDRNWKLVTY